MADVEGLLGSLGIQNPKNGSDDLVSFRLPETDREALARLEKCLKDRGATFVNRSVLIRAAVTDYLDRAAGLLAEEES